MLHDALTGLPNAVSLVDRLQQALARAARRKEQVALVYLDIDGFRKLVGANGEIAGGQLLQEVAARLQRCLSRQEDTVARLCSDQFVMVLCDVDGDQGVQKILDEVASAMRQKFCLAGTEVAMSASIGASLFPDDGEEWSPLLTRASTLMRRAKMLGGNCAVYCGAGTGTNGDDLVDRRHPLSQVLDKLRLGAVQMDTLAAAS